MVPDGLLDKAVHMQDTAYRNIASLRRSRNLFRLVTSNESDIAAAITAELDTRPRKPQPLINRPFEQWYGVIAHPFGQLTFPQSRYSDGSFGVWYGSRSVETTIYETAYHFVRELVGRGQHRHTQPVVRERRVVTASVDALMFDLQDKVTDFPDLVSKDSYELTQQIGRVIHDGHHPGLVSPSARYNGGVNINVFSPEYLSNPKDNCYLKYRFYPLDGRVEVERQPGTIWMTLTPEM